MENSTELTNLRQRKKKAAKVDTEKAQKKESDDSEASQEDSEEKSKAAKIKVLKKRRPTEPFFSTADIVMLTFAFLVIVLCSAGLYFQSFGDSLYQTMGGSSTSSKMSALMLTKEDITGQGWQMRVPNYKPKPRSNSYKGLKSPNDYKNPFDTDVMGS